MKKFIPILEPIDEYNDEEDIELEIHHLLKEYDKITKQQKYIIPQYRNNNYSRYKWNTSKVFPLVNNYILPIYSKNEKKIYYRNNLIIIS